MWRNKRKGVINNQLLISTVNKYWVSNGDFIDGY